MIPRLRILVALAIALAADGETITPRLVKDFTPGKVADRSEFAIPRGVGVGNVVFFRAIGAEPGLWRTDGTATGTHRVYDGFEGDLPGLPKSLSTFGRGVYYPNRSFNGGTSLYWTDGTAAGTRRIAKVTEFTGGAPCGDGKLCFAGANAEIGVTDGTEAGTRILLATAPGTHFPWAAAMTTLGNRVFFRSYDAAYGRCMSNANFERIICGEPWVSDGTVEGTHLFADLNPGVYPSGPYDLFSSRQGKVYFRALEPGVQWSWGGCQVWVTDGTPSGTQRLVPDLPRFNCNPWVPPFVEVGNDVYFLGAYNDLFRSGGTPESTKVIWSTRDDHNRQPWRLGTVNDTLLMHTGEGLWAWHDGTPRLLASGSFAVLGYLQSAGRLLLSQGDHLWSIDGSPDGTERHFALPDSHGTKFGWAVASESIYYGADDAVFVTDGTRPGTRKITLPAMTGKSSGAGGLVALDGKVFFTASALGRYGVSDGTAEGTSTFADAADGQDLILRDGRLYFYDEKNRMWTTDGTPAGTRLLHQVLGVDHVSRPPVQLDGFALFAGGSRSNPVLTRRDPDGTITPLPADRIATDLTRVGSSVLFWSSRASGYELMVSDGTASGTRALTEPVPSVSALGEFAGGVIFGVSAPDHGPLSLWVSDLTPEGTRLVRALGEGPFLKVLPLGSLGDAAIFAIAQGDNLGSAGQQIFRTDGTAAGTHFLNEERFIHVAEDGEHLTLLHVKVEEDSWEIWDSDGTYEGTVIRHSGHGRIMVPPFRDDQGRLRFVHTGDANELHLRDTATNSAETIQPGGVSPGRMVWSGDRLFFSGCRGATGCELWTAVPGDTVPPAPAEVRVDYIGSVKTVDGVGAAFRLRMETNGVARPRVVASTADGTLVAGLDYEGFSREVFFEGDQPVTLVVPLHSLEKAGTLSLVVSPLADATVVQGVATAHVPTTPRRRAAGH